MKIERFVLGKVQTNCYLIQNEETKEVLIVDPAVCPDYLLGHIKSKGMIPTAILLTHGHFDHIMGIDGWLAEYAIPVYLFEKEKEIIENPQSNLSGMVGESYAFSGATYTKEGENLQLAGFEIEVIHTPGHTIGSCSYYFKKEKIVVTGDTLFCREVGRSDLPTGNGAVLEKSIREKLYILPDETVVYPGHDDESSIGYEKTHNPYVR